MKAYDFIINKYMINTFVDGRYVKANYTRYDGADADYRWIADIRTADLNEITKIVNEVHEETKNKDYQPAFVLSSPYGNDYNDEFAPIAKKLFTEKNGFEVWNEI